MSFLSISSIASSLLRSFQPSGSLLGHSLKSHNFSKATRSITTSSPMQSSPRSKHLSQRGSTNKMKTHQGTKKRWTPLGSGSKASDILFKRGFAGKSHLNSGMARNRLNNLGGTTLAPRGRISKTLRRLLAPSL
ncbi:hypothetical protein IE53DRAFT_378622 [Violaceomyces palustris]|uniref:Uncharacterized protein n=1 Tax=Violaceomyces palustris TaxID=1673888 RepID=A0ACD0P1F2_9BASI|nr:hypothetical protein IE53DRAFT_378622 [Violaceomyces palustris]